MSPSARVFLGTKSDARTSATFLHDVLTTFPLISMEEVGSNNTAGFEHGLLMMIFVGQYNFTPMLVRISQF